MTAQIGQIVFNPCLWKRMGEGIEISGLTRNQMPGPFFTLTAKIRI